MVLNHFQHGAWKSCETRDLKDSARSHVFITYSDPDTGQKKVVLAWFIPVWHTDRAEGLLEHYGNIAQLMHFYRGGGGGMLFHHCFTQWWRETPTGGNVNCRRQQRFAQQGCKLEPVLQGVQSVISQFNVLILHIFAHPWTYLQQTPKWDLKAYIKYNTNDGGDRSGKAVSAVRHQKSGKLPDNVNKERWCVCVSVCVLPFWAHPDRSQLEGVTRGHNTVINNQCCCYVHRCPVRLFLLDHFHIESDFAVCRRPLIH